MEQSRDRGYVFSGKYAYKVHHNGMNTIGHRAQSHREAGERDERQRAKAALRLPIFPSLFLSVSPSCGLRLCG